MSLYGINGKDKISIDTKEITNYEYMRIFNPATNQYCRHYHHEYKQAIKCLFSFNNLQNGCVLHYIIEPSYRLYIKKEDRALVELPKKQTLLFHDLPINVKKKIKRSYLYYRARYNARLPENYFDYE